MHNLLLITSLAVGASLGALLRYGCTQFFIKRSFTFLPLGTLFVNIVGSFLIGLFTSFFLSYPQLQQDTISHFLFIGFLGALTTFSTFAFDTYFLWKSGAKAKAVLFIILNLFNTFLFAFLGLSIIF